MPGASRHNEGKPRLGLLPPWVWTDSASVAAQVYPLQRALANKDHKTAYVHAVKLNLLFVDCTADTVKVGEYGADKYAVLNWAKGLGALPVLDSFARHMLAMKTGQEFDDESGCRHIGHAAWNAAVLVSELQELSQ